MSPILLGADLVAIALLVFATYLPRHGRRDLMIAFLVVNVGVLAVSSALSSSLVGAGLGLGLFGVLSIIRLRSEELSHRDIAYYFAALALGLIAGLGVDIGLSVALMALVVAVLMIGDHPRLAGRTRTSQLVLDRVHPDEAELRTRVADLVPGRIVEVSVDKLDLVNDMTWVTVRSIQSVPRRNDKRSPGAGAATSGSTGGTGVSSSKAPVAVVGPAPASQPGRTTVEP